MTSLQNFLLLCILLITTITYFYTNKQSIEKKIKLNKNSQETIKIAKIVIPSKISQKTPQEESENMILNHLKLAMKESKKNQSTNAQEILSQLKKNMGYKKEAILEKNIEINIQKQYTQLDTQHKIRKSIEIKEKRQEKKRGRIHQKIVINTKKKSNKSQTKKERVKKERAKKNRAKIVELEEEIIQLLIVPEKNPVKKVKNNFSKLPFVKILEIVQESSKFEENIETIKALSPNSYRFIPLSKEDELSNLPFVKKMNVVNVSQTYELTESSLYK